MALKSICAIPRSWTLEEYSLHRCDDGSHPHFSRAQLYPKDEKGLVVWLRRSEHRRDKSIVWILPEHPGPSTKKPLTTGPINTGLSNRVGEQVAMAVYEGESWARVMLAHINMRREKSEGTN